MKNHEIVFLVKVINTVSGTIILRMNEGIFVFFFDYNSVGWRDEITTAPARKS